MAWLLYTLLSGLIIGGLGRLVVPGAQKMGLLGTLLIGLVGSVVGLGIAAVVPFFDHRELSGLVFNVAGAALAIVGWQRLQA